MIYNSMYNIGDILYDGEEGAYYLIEDLTIDPSRPNYKFFYCLRDLQKNLTYTISQKTIESDTYIKRVE